MILFICLRVYNILFSHTFVRSKCNENVADGSYYSISIKRRAEGSDMDGWSGCGDVNDEVCAVGREELGMTCKIYYSSYIYCTVWTPPPN